MKYIYIATYKYSHGICLIMLNNEYIGHSYTFTTANFNAIPYSIVTSNLI